MSSSTDMRPFLVTVKDGDAASGYIPSFGVYDDSIALTIVSPSAFGGQTTPTIQVGRSPGDDDLPTQFVDYYDKDQVIQEAPDTDRAETYFDLASTHGFRITFPGVVTGDVVFEVYRQIGIMGGGMG